MVWLETVQNRQRPTGGAVGEGLGRNWLLLVTSWQSRFNQSVVFCLSVLPYSAASSLMSEKRVAIMGTNMKLSLAWVFDLCVLIQLGCEKETSCCAWSFLWCNINSCNFFILGGDCVWSPDASWLADACFDLIWPVNRIRREGWASRPLQRIWAVRGRRRVDCQQLLLWMLLTWGEAAERHRTRFWWLNVTWACSTFSHPKGLFVLLLLTINDF